MFTSPGAIAFHLAGITIYWYGIIISGAFLIGLMSTEYVVKKFYKHINPESLYDLAPVMLLGAILGARLYYAALNAHYYGAHPLDILQIWHGGLSIHGAIFGGFLFSWIYLKRKKLDIWQYADVLSYGLIIGQAIGRWGNFFNSEAFGRPTNLPWKLFIPVANRPEAFANYEYFHPTFLYEFFWNIAVFAILFFVLKKTLQGKHGGIFFSYLVLYSIGRILIESIRIDSAFVFLGVSIAIWMSILFMGIGIFGLYMVWNGKEFPAFDLDKICKQIKLMSADTLENILKNK